MIQTKTILQEQDVVELAVCDRCDRVIDPEVEVFEFQEMISIRTVGGYGSVFGDGAEIELDLCQRCLFELITEIKEK
jgi:hypothetical protein